MEWWKYLKAGKAAGEVLSSTSTCTALVVQAIRLPHTCLVFQNQMCNFTGIPQWHTSTVLQTNVVLQPTENCIPSSSSKYEKVIIRVFSSCHYIVEVCWRSYTMPNSADFRTATSRPVEALMFFLFNPFYSLPLSYVFSLSPFPIPTCIHTLCSLRSVQSSFPLLQTVFFSIPTGACCDKCGQHFFTILTKHMNMNMNMNMNE